MHSRADIGKAEKLLGYKATKSVKQGLEELIELECE